MSYLFWYQALKKWLFCGSLTDPYSYVRYSISIESPLINNAALIGSVCVAYTLPI